MPSYCEDLARREAEGETMPRPSMRFRLPASLQVRINDIAYRTGTDRDGIIVKLIEDGLRVRETVEEVRDGA